MGPLPVEPLTPREQQTLDLIVAGKSNKEMAKMLGISPRTIEVHRSRIMLKFGAHNAADLVRKAMLAGLSA